MGAGVGAGRGGRVPAAAGGCSSGLLPLRAALTACSAARHSENGQCTLAQPSPLQRMYWQRSTPLQERQRCMRHTQLRGCRKEALSLPLCVAL